MSVVRLWQSVEHLWQAVVVPQLVVVLLAQGAGLLVVPPALLLPLLLLQPHSGLQRQAAPGAWR